MDRVVPIAVEVVTLKRQGFKDMLGNFLFGLIVPGIELGAYAESCARCRVGDKVDDDLMTHKRSSTPVLRNVRKEPVLNLVPLARSRWKVTDGEGQSGIVRPLLQIRLPKVSPPVSVRGNLTN